MFEHRLGYTVTRIKQKFIRDRKKRNEAMVKYFRRGGVKIGNNCCILSDLDKSDKEMITIGDNVTVSSYVLFVTHDHSIYHIRGEGNDLRGRIKIGNNCFIGERALIMYGVTLADNIIVASGAVVTKSFPQSNVIIGGNPAKIIGYWSDFERKYKDNRFLNREDYLNSLEDENDPRYIKRKNYCEE